MFCFPLVPVSLLTLVQQQQQHTSKRTGSIIMPLTMYVICILAALCPCHLLLCNKTETVHECCMSCWFHEGQNSPNVWWFVDLAFLHTPSLRMLALFSIKESISTKKASGCFLSQLWQDPPLLVPAKVLPTHLVEMVIKRPVEISESLQDLCGDLGMRSALRFSKAARSAAPLGLLQAGETFCLVEVEVLVWNNPFQTKEVLNPAHLASRIRHQSLTTNKQKMRQGEVLEPVLQMFGIEADAHCTPCGVNQTRCGVF